MNPLLYLAGAGLVVVGLVGLLLPVLPGTLFIVLGIGAIALADGFARIGPWTLALIALIGLATWGVDALSGVVGARAAGASRWGIIGGFLGLVAGIPFGLPGIIVGPAVGATALEYWKDPNLRQASRAGAGVLVGFIVGNIVKYALAFTMIGVATFAYWY